MARRLTQKQETFCLKYFELGNATEAALVAGYSPHSVRFIASINLTKDNIQRRIKELRQIAEDATVATVLERKQVLTEIIRGRFADFMTNLTKEKLQSAALQEIRITEVGKDIPVKTTSIKLHSPAQAIDLLNKMDKLYAEGTITIDNRTLNINVISDKGKNLTERLIEGERTSGDNDH